MCQNKNIAWFISKNWDLIFLRSHLSNNTISAVPLGRNYDIAEFVIRGLSYFGISLNHNILS